MFTLASFVVAGDRAGALARRARAAGDRRASRCRSRSSRWCARNRRRYGGYFVHVGIITLFVGVAASSSFKDVQDVALRPGRPSRSATTSSRTSSRSPSCTRRSNGRLERIALGAQLRVRQERRQAQAAAHVEGLLPVAGLVARARLALLRRRVDDRGRPRRRACATTSGPRSRRTSPSSARGSTRATSSSTRPPTT